VTSAADAPGLITVRLVDLPVEVHLATAAHQDALQRELDVVRTAEANESVPHRLFALLDELEQRYGGVGEQPRAELDRAVELGQSTIELVYQVPPDTAEACVRLSTILDEVDDYCRAGEHLLTLATPPEELKYRRWFLSEFIAQIGGEVPTPWSDFTDQGPLELVSEPAGGARDSTAPTNGSESHDLPDGWAVDHEDALVIVRPAGELDLATAPEVRELLLAVRNERTGRIQLDLGNVTFIDSVGLSMIVSAHQRLHEDGVGLEVVVPPMLRRLFDISGLGELLDVVP
jgi:anti-anti-sigma factor